MATSLDLLVRADLHAHARLFFSYTRLRNGRSISDARTVRATEPRLTESRTLDHYCNVRPDYPIRIFRLDLGESSLRGTRSENPRKRRGRYYIKPRSISL